MRSGPLAAVMLLVPCADARAQADDSTRRAQFIALTRAPLQHPSRTADVRRETLTVGQRDDGSALVVDVTRPAGRSPGRLPVVLLVHGGLADGIPASLRPRAWQLYRDWAAALAGAGVAAVMFEHSLGSPVRRPDRALGEADAVMRWIARDGERLGLANDSVSIVAFSAGGSIAARLADHAARALPAARLALVYPVLDMSGAADRIARQGTSLLVVRAGGDAVPGLLDSLDASVHALVRADARIEVINIPSAPHSFDILIDTPASRAAIERVVRFATGHDVARSTVR
jgi:acetyl esterase/lipase